MSTGQQPIPESELKLLETRLVSSSFECSNPVKLGPIQVEDSSLETKCNVSKSRKEIRVFLTYTTTAKEKDTLLFKLKATYFGCFKAGDGITEEQLTGFSKMNAPAIVFPLLRATIATLTLAAGFPPLTLPIVNFTKAPATVEQVD